MTACAEVLRVKPRFVALELSPDQEREIREHLATCPSCRARVGESEPALGLALRMAATRGPEDDAFVGEVLAGVHQRKIEKRLRARRKRWTAAAAAVVVTALGAGVTLRLRAPGPPAVEARVSAPAKAAAEPAFVEVEGEDVRLYQLTSSSQGTVQAALIVDPHLEL